MILVIPFTSYIQHVLTMELFVINLEKKTQLIYYSL